MRKSDVQAVYKSLFETVTEDQIASFPDFWSRMALQIQDFHKSKTLSKDEVDSIIDDHEAAISADPDNMKLKHDINRFYNLKINRMKEEGREEEACEVWTKILNNNRDIGGKDAAHMVHIFYEHALLLIENGRAPEAIPVLLDSFEMDKDWQDQSAMKTLKQLFNALGARHEAVIKGKERLAKHMSKHKE